MYKNIIVPVDISQEDRGRHGQAHQRDAGVLGVEGDAAEGIDPAWRVRSSQLGAGWGEDPQERPQGHELQGPQRQDPRHGDPQPAQAGRAAAGEAGWLGRQGRQEASAEEGEGARRQG